MKRSHPDCLEPPKVLILCQDTRTCFQLRQFLTQGGERFLLYAAMQHEIPIGKLAESYDNVKNVKEIEKALTQLQQPTPNTRVTQKLGDAQKKVQASSSQTDAADEEKNAPLDELTQLLTSTDGDYPLSTTFFQESYLLTMTQLNDIDDASSTFAEFEDAANASGAAAINMNASIFEPFPEVCRLA